MNPYHSDCTITHFGNVNFFFFFFVNFSKFVLEMVKHLRQLCFITKQNLVCQL